MRAGLLEVEADDEEAVDEDKRGAFEVVGLAFDGKVVHDDDGEDDGEHHEHGEDHEGHVVIDLYNIRRR